MITAVEAYRYRCFSSTVVEFGDYNVLAGPNGSGKTLLMDIPTLLGDLIAQSRSISSAFLELQPGRGARRAQRLQELTHFGRGNDLAFAIEAALPDEIRRTLAAAQRGRIDPDDPQAVSHLRYEVRLEVFSADLQVAGEYLYLFPASRPPERGGQLIAELLGVERMRRRGWVPLIYRDRGGPTVYWGLHSPYTEEGKRSWRQQQSRVPPERMGLPSIPYDREEFLVPTWFRDFLFEGVVFFDPDWRQLREPSRPGQPLRLLSDGRNLPWLVKDLQERDPGQFADWVAHVRTALPQVVDIRAVEREEDHFAYLALSYSGGYQATSSGLSDGTLRILALTVVPYLIDRPRLFVIEEPENGIHPRAIESVLQSLRSVYGSQVWISTHSPVVVALTEPNVMLLSRIDDDGEASVVPGDEHPRLKAWQGEIDLGALFAAGVLNG